MHATIPSIMDTKPQEYTKTQISLEEEFDLIIDNAKLAIKKLEQQKENIINNYDKAHHAIYDATYEIVFWANCFIFFVVICGFGYVLINLKY